MDAPLLHGLFSILLLHTCMSQVLTSETLSALDSNLPLTAVIAHEPEVTELSLTAPGSEQEAVKGIVKGVVQDGVEAAAQDTVKEAAEEAVSEASPGAADPGTQDAEVAEEVSQEVAADVGEEVGAAAAEEEAAAEATGEDAALEAAEEAGEQAVTEVTVAEAGEGAEEQAGATPGEEAAAEAGDGGEQPEADASEEVVEVGQEAAVEVGVEDGGEAVVETGEMVEVDGTEAEASQASETEEPDRTPGPADTYVPPQSQGPANAGSQAESNHVGGEIGEESNHFNEIITHAGELLNLVPAEAAPTADNVVEAEEVPATLSTALLGEEAGGESEAGEAAADAEGVALGLEAWKIGAISAAVFLFLETIVIIVYFLKCRKTKISGATPAKASGDCEAAQTAAEDTTDESTPAADEDQTQQNAISESLDMSQFQQEETMADIPLDPTDPICPEDPVEDVRTSVL